ncbi:hypothetical protein M8J76_001978 [Diaphorina citri]|nr:hypothetical protein M8J76_001978 [Diaphorina citri]
MEDYSVDEDDDGNRTPTNEDPGPLCNHEESRPPSHNAQDYKIDIHFADTESLEKCYVFVTERGICELYFSDYQLHSVLDENNLVVEVNMNSSEGGGETHSHPCHNCRGDSHSSQCTEFHSYRDYAYSLSEQNDGSRIKDQLACYDRAIEELSINPQHHHSFPQNGGSFQQNGGSFPQNGAHECNRPRTYGENKIHELIDKDLKCLSDQLLSEKHQMYHELYSSGDSVNRSPGDSDLDRLLSSEDKKRKLLVSMTNIDLADEDKGGEDSGEEGDPPFWASEEGGGGGRFSCVRQNTVIYNEDKSAVSSPNQGQGCIREDSMSTTSSSDPSENHRNTTPKHLNPLKSTTSILRETTLERGRLEEAVGVLRSRVELADATQSLALKSDTVSALEETVAKHEATIAHHLALVNTLSYQNQNYQAEINHLTSLYTKDESVDRIAQLEASTVNLKKKIDYLNAQVNSLSEENIVLHEFIANIDSEEGRNLNIPASFKMMKKQNFLPQTSTASNVNQSHNIPQEIYDDILNLKLNLEKEVMLRKKLEEEYSIELGRKLQDMEIKHAEELKKQEQCLRKEKVLKIDAELRHKKELDLERQILLHEITKLKSELKNRELHIVKMETQLRAHESDKKLARKQLIDSVNREIAETSE